jgi:hypothetical protein
LIDYCIMCARVGELFLCRRPPINDSTSESFINFATVWRARKPDVEGESLFAGRSACASVNNTLALRTNQFDPMKMGARRKHRAFLIRRRRRPLSTTLKITLCHKKQSFVMLLRWQEKFIPIQMLKLVFFVIFFLLLKCNKRAGVKRKTKREHFLKILMMNF